MGIVEGLSGVGEGEEGVCEEQGGWCKAREVVRAQEEGAHEGMSYQGLGML